MVYRYFTCALLLFCLLILGQNCITMKSPEELASLNDSSSSNPVDCIALDVSFITYFCQEYVERGLEATEEFTFALSDGQEASYDADFLIKMCSKNPSNCDPEEFNKQDLFNYCSSEDAIQNDMNANRFPILLCFNNPEAVS